MHRRRGIAIGTSMLLVVAACAGGDSSAPPIESAAGAGGDTTEADAAPTESTAPITSVPGVATTVPSAPPTPNPLPIAFATDDSAAGSAEIGVEGGTVLATDASGVTFALEIPSGALLSRETVTITPISITASPLDDVTVLGVDLQPDGLILLKPGSLSISGADVGAAEVIPFGARAGGEDFHQLPTAEPDALVLQVAHFSALGVLLGDAAAREALAAYTPSDREASFLTALTLTDPDEWLGILDTWFGRIAADATGASDAATAIALTGELLAAWTVVGHLGLFLEPSVAAVEHVGQTLIPSAGVAGRSLQDAYFRLFERAEAACVGGDADSFFAMSRWGALHAVFLQLGLGSHDRDSRIDAALARCGRFTVLFASRAIGMVEGVNSTVTVSAEIPLVMDKPAAVFFSEGNAFPAVSGPVTGTGGFSPFDPGCTVQAGTVSVVLMPRIRIGTVLSDTTFGDMGLQMHFEEYPAMTCGVVVIEGGAFWAAPFAEIHSHRRSGTTYSFTVDRVDTPEAYARFEQQGFDFTVGDFEVLTIIEVVHEPGD